MKTTAVCGNSLPTLSSSHVVRVNSVAPRFVLVSFKRLIFRCFHHFTQIICRLFDQNSFEIGSELQSKVKSVVPFPLPSLPKSHHGLRSTTGHTGQRSTTIQNRQFSSIHNKMYVVIQSGFSFRLISVNRLSSRPPVSPVGQRQAGQPLLFDFTVKINF